MECCALCDSALTPSCPARGRPSRSKNVPAGDPVIVTQIVEIDILQKYLLLEGFETALKDLVGTFHNGKIPLCNLCVDLVSTIHDFDQEISRIRGFIQDQVDIVRGRLLNLDRGIVACKATDGKVLELRRLILGDKTFSEGDCTVEITGSSNVTELPLINPRDTSEERQDFPSDMFIKEESEECPDLSSAIIIVLSDDDRDTDDEGIVEDNNLTVNTTIQAITSNINDRKSVPPKRKRNSKRIAGPGKKSKFSVNDPDPSDSVPLPPPAIQDDDFPVEITIGFNEGVEIDKDEDVQAVPGNIFTVNNSDQVKDGITSEMDQTDQEVLKETPTKSNGDQKRSRKYVTTDKMPRVRRRTEKYESDDLPGFIRLGRAKEIAPGQYECRGFKITSIGEGGKFRCDTCNRVLASRERAWLHLKRFHLNPKSPMLCPICGKSFSKDSYPNHRKMHLDERKYMCEECGKSWNTSSELHSHQVTHRKTRPFVCDFQDCGLTFARKANLRLHKLLHTKESPYNCEICHKNFPTSCGLRLHNRFVHSEERPYTCPHCPSTFKKNSHLKRHLRNVHPDRPAVSTKDKVS